MSEFNDDYIEVPNEYIKLVLSQVRPGTKIRLDAIELVKTLVNPLLINCDTGKVLDDEKHKNTENFIHAFFDGNIHKHATRELAKSCSKDKGYKYIRYVVMEYIMAEILELAGKYAYGEKKKRLTKDHINVVIDNDEELSALFEKIKKIQ
jgi:hypothetical protein